MDNFNVLPEEIIWDIFTRLPAESVLECKLVSETWKNHILHPSFTKMHADGHNHYADSGKLGFLALAKDKQLYYFEYIESHETPIGKTRRIKFTPPFKCHTFAGSFNGLVCLRGWKERFCICNPMTKEYAILPDPMADRFRPIGRGRYRSIGFGGPRWIGFGYLPSTNEYKVVIMHKLEKECNFEVMVYTLGSRNGWRNIGKFGLQNNYVYEGLGFFVNGALHWLHKKRSTILVFDLADERFREHLSPPPHEKGNPLLDLGVFDGCLVCRDRFGFTAGKQYLFRYNIWLYKKNNDDYDMKEQDEHQSMDWSRVFTAASAIPVAFTKSGDFLGYNSSYITNGTGPGLDYSFSYLNIYDAKNVNPKNADGYQGTNL